MAADRHENGLTAIRPVHLVSARSCGLLHVPAKRSNPESDAANHVAKVVRFSPISGHGETDVNLTFMYLHKPSNPGDLGLTRS